MAKTTVKRSRSTTVRKPVLVEIARLKAAPYNPKRRTDKSRLGKLQASMQDVGLLYPIIVDSEMNVIDGHRRIAAAVLLGWKAIAAFVIKCDSPEHLYASVNVTAMRMSGNDALGVWLECRSAVHESQQKQFSHMEAILGLQTLTQAQKDGYSYGTFRETMRLAHYCGNTGADFVKTAFLWMTEFSSGVAVKRAIDMGEPARVFIEAIRRKRPVRLKLAVSE